MQEILQKLSHALESEPDIAFAYLFGSMAKGRSGPLSDVDVAVYFHPSGNRRTRFDRRLQLMSQLGRLLQRDDVDVVPLQDASPDLTFEILAYGKLIFSKDDTQKVTFIFETLRKYHDEAQRRKFEWNVIREEIKRGIYGRPPRKYSRATQKAA
ncbi:MAG: nucleotidyltransferase domain-containing protein [candidate division KSB1 bacterium]|nr:nucleotidyltransferase domain-containing protein [candidate division KSB1 bacterium]MDZ7302483.1 nucleotidyltransferase domain-containing protein [candidate division KSB1 bacterium]MDZ7311921.1 nucleotidyltransferase domain-containing protein [candidate division KSB1 bacterium]